MKESEFSKLILDIYTWRIRDTLDCQNKGIDDHQALQLAQALKENPYIHSIRLSGNRISDAGATQLLEKCYKASNIKSIHLAGNNIRQLTTLSRFQTQQKSLKINISANPIIHEKLHFLPANFLSSIIVNQPNPISSPSPKTRQTKKNPKIITASLSHPINTEFATKLADPQLKINQMVDEITAHPQWSSISAKNLTQMFCKLATRYIKLQDLTKPFFKDLYSKDKLRKLSFECLSKYSQEVSPLLKDGAQLKLSLQAQRLSGDLKNRELTDIFCALALFKMQDIPLIQSLWKRTEKLAKEGLLTHHHLLRILWAISKLEVPSIAKQKMGSFLEKWIDLKRPCFTVKHLLKAAEALININLEPSKLHQALQGLLEEILLRIQQESSKGSLDLRQLLSCKELSILEKILNIEKVYPSNNLLALHKTLISLIDKEIDFRKTNMKNKMQSKSEYLNLKQIKTLLSYFKKKTETPSSLMADKDKKTCKDSLLSPRVQAQSATFAYSSVVLAKEQCPSACPSPTSSHALATFDYGYKPTASTHFTSPKCAASTKFTGFFK